MSTNLIRVGVGAGGVAVAAAGAPAVMVAAGATLAVGLAGYGVYKVIESHRRPRLARRSLAKRGR
jgi:hypothetical protein